MKRNLIKIPKRPSLPTILVFALMFWAFSAFVYANAPIIMIEGEIEVPKAFCPFGMSGLFVICLICGFIVCICAILLVLKGEVNIIILSVLAAALGVGLALMSASIQQNKEVQALNLPEDTYKIYITEDSRAGTYNTSANAELFDKNGAKYKVKIQYSECDHEIHAGEHIIADCKLSKPADSQTNNYWQNGLCATVKISNIKQDSVTDLLSPVFSFRNHLIDTIRKTDKFGSDLYSEAEQLLSAIICGQRIDINSGDVYSWFKNAGLAHLVAVSGAHLSLVTGLLIILLKRLRVQRWFAIFLQSLFILAYLICAAIPISALRAAFMAYVALFAFFGKRRGAPLNGLGLCIIILIAINPQTAISVSFALSAGSTIGIILFGNLLNYYIVKNWPKCPEFVSGALSMTFAANICTLPLSISIFGQIPLIAPIANIICAPLFTVLCGAGLVFSVIASWFIAVWPTLAEFIMLSSKSRTKGNFLL